MSSPVRQARASSGRQHRLRGETTTRPRRARWDDSALVRFDRHSQLTRAVRQITAHFHSHQQAAYRRRERRRRGHRRAHRGRGRSEREEPCGQYRAPRRGLPGLGGSHQGPARGRRPSQRKERLRSHCARYRHARGSRRRSRCAARRLRLTITSIIASTGVASPRRAFIRYSTGSEHEAARAGPTTKHQNASSNFERPRAKAPPRRRAPARDRDGASRRSGSGVGLAS